MFEGLHRLVIDGAIHLLHPLEFGTNSCNVLVADKLFLRSKQFRITKGHSLNRSFQGIHGERFLLLRLKLFLLDLHLGHINLKIRLLLLLPLMVFHYRWQHYLTLHRTASIKSVFVLTTVSIDSRLHLILSRVQRASGSRSLKLTFCLPIERRG